MEKNIKLNYVVTALTNFGVTSMWMLYLSYKGLNLIEIGILEAIFHITSFLFEVPSGALADIFGRKKTLILARIITIISSFILIFANSFLTLGFGFVISAASYAFTTGSSDALIYDSLKVINKESNFIKITANLKVLDEIVYNFGLIIAGILADIYFESVYIIAICLAVITIIVLTRMKEPITISTKVSFDMYLDILKSAFKIIKEDILLFYFLITSAIFSTIMATFFFYFQPYLEMLGYLKKEISLLILISGLFQAIAIKFSPVIAKTVSTIKVFQFNLLISSIILLLIGIINSKIILLGFVVVNSLFSLLIPLLYNEIQQKIPSEQRATITSVESMLYSIMMIILFPIIGLIGEINGIKYGFLILASCMFLLLIFIRVKMNKN